jgi:hypothetical protein
MNKTHRYELTSTHEHDEEKEQELITFYILFIEFE